MKLLYPEFLYALLALAIPVLIHLFNFRKYKRIEFSQVRFLKNIKKETNSRSKIKHWLVLLSRILFISCLVLAFCQPYLIENEGTASKGKKGISIYLDNSFSMQAKGEEGILLEQAKNQALAVVEAFSQSDRFQLITNDFSASERRWLTKEEVINAIPAIVFSASSRKLSEIVSRQNALYEDNKALIAERYLISDMQFSFFDWNNLKDSLSFNLIALQAEALQNVSLDSMWFSKPFRSLASKEQLSFSVRNHDTEEKEELNVQLILNRQLRTPMQIRVPAKDSSHNKIIYKNSDKSWQLGKLSIQDYPINFDDTLFFAYQQKKRINIIHLYEKNASKAIANLFEQDSLIKYQASSTKQLSFNTFSNSSLIILDGISQLSSGLQNELINFIKEGKSISIFPSAAMDPNQINRLLSALKVDEYSTFQEDDLRINELNKNAQLFEQVFTQMPQNINLPKVKYYWGTSNKNRTSAEVLMRFNNGLAALSKYKSLGGNVYLSSIMLDDSSSNFTQHAVFVPTLYNMALQSEKANTPLFYLDEPFITVGPIAEVESPVSLKQGQFELIPPQQRKGKLVQIELDQTQLKSGHYKLLQGETLVSWLGLNYSRKESAMELYELDKLLEKSQAETVKLILFDTKDQALTQEIQTASRGTDLWKLFIVLALVFLGTEIALLRLLK